MDGEATTRICTNEACQFAETGQCVEGNTVEECPHLGNTADAKKEDAAELDIPPEVQPQKVARLFTIGGESTLSVSKASSLLKSEPAPVLAFLGQAEAGKTSLIAEVYDAFQYGEYTALRFAGSKTLMAFERICHKVRASSRAPDLAETRTDFSDDPTFYHLTIHEDATGLTDILLADRSGETYREVMNTPERVSVCVELRRAAILNLLVDGDRLYRTSERTLVISECTQLMQTLAFSGVLPQDIRINIVLTKLDCVDGSPNKDSAHAAFDRIVGQVRKQTNGRVGGIRTFKIAARPQGGLYSKGHGVETLVRSWLTPVSMTVPYVPPSPLAIRSIDRLRSSMEVI